MENTITIRWNWIRGMYIYTLFGAGTAGLAVLFAQDWIQELFSLPKQDPSIFGIAGSIWLAFGILSFFGLRDPMRFLPVLLIQLTYKSIWVAGVAIPLMLKGVHSQFLIMNVIIMASFIIGDLIAIPFSYLFSGGRNQGNNYVPILTRSQDYIQVLFGSAR